MIQKFVAGAVMAAALLMSAPATAATTISFTGSSTGNATGRTFTTGGYVVQASAWSYEGSTLERASLGSYSNGLGVINNDEDGSNNSHAVDNLRQHDFILLIFNQSVNIASAVLNPYAQFGSSRDNDVSVSYTNVAGLFGTPASSIQLNNPLFAALQGNLRNLSGNMTSPFSTSLNSTGKFGNVWLIGAARTNPDQTLDGFKLASVRVTPAVPEPGTWAMMLIGFGAVGYSMRRARRVTAMPQLA